MSFLLTVCTAGWVMCGQVTHAEFPTMAACQTERREMYRLQGRDAFKWITCEPITPQLRKQLGENK